MIYKQERGFGIAGLLLLIVIFAIFTSLMWYGYQSGRFDGVPFMPTLLHQVGDKKVGTLTGTVTAGPTMPVCIAGKPCTRVVPDRIINAEDVNGNVVATAVTDKNGVYAMYLAPGTYTLVSVPAIGLRPSQQVTVISGMNHFDMQLDTGIR